MFTKEQVKSVRDFVKSHYIDEFTGKSLNKNFKDLRRKEINAILCIIKVFDPCLTTRERSPKCVKTRPIWSYKAKSTSI